MPTIQVRAAPAGEEEVGKTVVMKAGDSAPPAGGKPTPQPTTNAEATIVMSAPAAATAPRPAPEATMRASAPAMTMKSAAPPVTIRTTTPTSKVPAAEPTVRTPAPAKPPAAPAPPVTVTAPTPIPPASVPVATGARRQGISPALLLALAAMVFLAALVGAGLFIWSRQAGTTEAPPATTLEAAPVTMGTLPPAAPPPSLAAQGTLHVETQPPGATVSVAGEVKGQTPLDLSLALGIHEIRLELKGYDARTQNVALTAETPQADVKVTLARAGPAMGTADFLSTPFGAAVSVDGSHVGQTPLTGYKLKPGLHQVDVSKDGYEPYSTTIKVEAGKPPARVDTALTALPQPTATPPPVETVDPNRVYLNSPSEVDTVARRLGGVSPAYPAAAPRLRSGESVSVSGTFVVTDAGDVTDVKVVESGGKQVDDAVIAAVRDWKFSPALKKGVKVKVRVTFKQTFRAG